MFEKQLTELQAEVKPLNEMEERADKIIKYLEDKLNEIGIKTNVRNIIRYTGPRYHLELEYGRHHVGESDYYFYLSDGSRLRDAPRKLKIKAVEYFEAALHTILESLKEEARQVKDVR